MDAAGEADLINSYVGVTDKTWFSLLRSQPGIDEVNFWLPSGRVFKALKPGELFLFKLHYPDHYIVGGGLFAHSTVLSVSLAWDAFGIKNGAGSLGELREKIDKYRKQESDRFQDYQIGCTLLEQPFFLPEEKWIPAPKDWSKNIVSGKTYDLSVEPGATIFRQLNAQQIQPQVLREVSPRYGEPVLVQPRLGQGSFRVLVTDAYERRCAISSERTLPVLEAAHIKPYSELGEHKVTNGILLRQDIHTLFDKGYLTITPDLKIEVSRRIREEFENGRDYYKYNGQPMRPPQSLMDRPSSEYLAWHNETVYRG
jgi:putative restriction endonuclease